MELDAAIIGANGQEQLDHELDYATAFATMSVRRFQRRWFGTHANLSFTRMITFFMALVMAVLYYRYHRTVPFEQLSPDGSFGSGENEQIAVIAVPEAFVRLALFALSFTVCMSCCCNRGAWLVRWMINLFLLGIFIRIACEKPEDYIKDTGWLGRTVHWGLFVTMLMALVIWATCEVFYPFIAKRGWLFFRDVATSYRIRPLGQDHPCHYKYCPAEPQGVRPFWPFSLCCGRNAIFSYVGELDAQGRPHGLGQWTDSEYHGECLKGYWRHGVLVGPFRSVEQGSGYGLSSVRIGFASCSTESDWGRTNLVPTSSPLRWGVSAVEASTNGQFYRHLPSAEILKGPVSGKGAQWVLDRLLHMQDGEIEVCRSLTVTVGENSRRLAVTGHTLDPGSDRKRAEVKLAYVTLPASLGMASLGSTDSVVSSEDDDLEEDDVLKAQRRKVQMRVRQPRGDQDRQQLEPTDRSTQMALKVVGWSPSSSAHGEVLLFIHGWQSSLKQAHLVLAQFLTLAGCPSHLKPVVFNWPCGGLFTYDKARDSGCQSTETRAAFVELLRSLANSGIRKVHILAHSMGARVLCHSLRDIAPLFISLADLRSSSVPDVEEPTRRTDVVEGSSPRLELSTVSCKTSPIRTHAATALQT